MNENEILHINYKLFIYRTSSDKNFSILFCMNGFFRIELTEGRSLQNRDNHHHNGHIYFVCHTLDPQLYMSSSHCIALYAIVKPK